MINPTVLLSYQKQRGAAVLTAVILLLTLVTLVTLYTGKIKSLENKISLNTQNKSFAFSAAEAGLNKALGTLTEQPGWAGEVFTETLTGLGTMTVSGFRKVITRDSTTMQLVTISSLGTSPDGLSTVTLREQALLYSVLANLPDVPLIVAGGLAVSGNFEVVSNPNGGGDGVALSIWTDLDVDMNSGGGTTCGLQEFKDGNCSTSPYSKKGFQDADILDNAPGFPDDLMEYLFNIPQAQWDTLRSDADERHTNCDSLESFTVGLIWIDGDCKINAGTVVGAPSSPVIMVVTDGDLTMNGGSEINGMLFSFRKPGVVTNFEINMLGGARVNGAVVSNHRVGHASGTYNSVYDADVLAQLQQHDAFQRVARVPGSWQDF